MLTVSLGYEYGVTVAVEDEDGNVVEEFESDEEFVPWVKNRLREQIDNPLRADYVHSSAFADKHNINNVRVLGSVMSRMDCLEQSPGGTSGTSYQIDESKL